MKQSSQQECPRVKPQSESAAMTSEQQSSQQECPSEAVKSTAMPKSLQISVDHRHRMNEDRKNGVSCENLSKN
ncbi:hypothetical protein AVEN_145849-1, partial [Araneus ventricosus]